MLRIPAFATAFAVAFQLALPAHAACTGVNLFDELPAEDLVQIEAATNAVPFPRGNFWRATRGEEVITIAGTYHLSDPRHQANLDRLLPHITSATTVLVEAGPDEQAALRDLMTNDPSLMLITDGPALNEQLPPDLWEDLASAMSARGIPAFMTAKFRPPYLMMILSLPPCAMTQMQKQSGLDHMVIDAALAAGIPVRGLEPYDTVLTVFDALFDDDLARTMTAALALEPRSEDYFRTLVDAYFHGENRKTWELMRFLAYKMPEYTREEMDAEIQQMGKVMMENRNRAWIPVLTEAAADGPVFAAFGALHLSGEAGVLNLLVDQGFVVEELTL